MYLRRKIHMRKYFIKATEEYNTLEKSVPAYYFRRTYNSGAEQTVKIRIAVCGFYELYFNGERKTRGFLSPYISNTNDYIYYDEYEVRLSVGENVIGVHLGNGFQNNPGGYIWDFDKASFRSAPMFSLIVTRGEEILLKSSSDFKTCPSPIRSDDYRFGEYYDARYEIAGWNEKGFDDSSWGAAIPAVAPLGELAYSAIRPIIKEREREPVRIFRKGDGFIYDFGESNAGICRLRIRGKAGQRIELRHSDAMKDGDICMENVWFVRDMWERDRHLIQCDTYVCRGEGEEIYEPTFTYHGFRYVRVDGIEEEQATKSLLTYLVYHTELNTVGDFDCSDKVASMLQKMTRRSILSNFHHFPTDCPQREKNGWTADAALTCEAALLNFDPEINYRQWLKNICKAQSADGELPGIIPTDGWGFNGGNGPAWDSVLAYLPYFTYVYRGEVSMIREAAPTFITYLKYLRRRCDEKGLLHIGLGDWCHVGGIPPKAPLNFTDTVMAMDIAEKISFMLDRVNMPEESRFAKEEAGKYKAAVRCHLIDFDKMTAAGNCQSSQAMALYYGIFEKNERSAAFDRLLELIHGNDDHIDIGVLGARVIFHVLSEFGYSDLAFKMITREDYPSYGNWIKRGATTLWEDFYPDRVSSMNHHFWGDISAWFIKRIAGICLNPEGAGVNTVRIKPSFIGGLDNASAYHIAPAGKISVSWHREGESVILSVTVPNGVGGSLELEPSYVFEDGGRVRCAVTGVYKITPSPYEA